MTVVTAGRPAARPRLGAALARVTVLAAVMSVVGLLPWLSGRDAALTVLRARSAEQEPTPEALAAIRADLGLDAGPLTLLGRWVAGLLRGDAGTSWVSGQDVLPLVLSGLGVSLTLMGAAGLVALIVAALLCLPTLLRGANGSPRRRDRSTGATAAVLAALPEFLLATLLLLVFAVWLRWSPPYGWQGPEHLLLPALALGLPAGGLLGRLLDDALPAVFAERWVSLWAAAGCTPGRIAAAALRRTVPALVPQIGLVAIGLTGGAVAVETIFAIPGIGRTALGAARAQDLPMLQGSVLALVLLGTLAGLLADLTRRSLLGPGLRDAALALPAPLILALTRRRAAAALALTTLLLTAIGAGLLRDDRTVDLAFRLAPPSLTHPLGADGLGRDVLARLGHGAATTLGIATLICLCSYALGLLIGFLPTVAAGATDIANAVPPVIAGLIVVAILGPGTWGASIAVALVSWPPLAAHTSALVAETRAAGHLVAQRAIGATERWVLLHHVIPAVASPVARHAVLRLPAIALALASLGFLGLGTQPPAPEWGLMLAESLPYLERAPWAALAPATALAVLAALATSLSTLGRFSRAR